MKSINPKDLAIHVNECPPAAQKEYRVGIDTEFFHMEKSKLHRPCGVFAGMGATYDGKEIWIITDETVIPDFMYQIDAGVHVYHNSLFDIRQIRRYSDYPDRTRLWDTMIMEQIMFSGWYSAGEFSLADLSRRYLDMYMDKSVREEFETSDKMSKEQIEYLAVDIVTTWRVYQEQKKIADENDLNVWKNIDRPAVYSLLGVKGMKLDTEAWNKLYEFNMAESERIRAKYEGINLGSWQQVLKRLKADGFTKLDSTNEKALNTITGESEFARDVLEYRGRVKAAGTYGMKWVEEWVEPDGRIYSSFYVNGTATGRFCVSADTILETTQGTFRICDLPLTDTGFGAVLTHRNRYQNILNKIHKGKEEMFLVTLDNGSQIKCTMNHRFLTNNGWKRLKDIIADDDTICDPGKAY